MSTSALPSYETFLSTFRVEDLAAQFAGNLDTGLNVCYECCDRYAGRNKTALVWESKDGRNATYTFDELMKLSAQFANILHEHGIGPGDRVAALLPRIPELLIVALGTWRAGAIYQTLFTAFGPKAIEYRIQQSDARLLVVDGTNRAKLEGISSLPPIMTVVTASEETSHEGDLDFWHEMQGQGTTFEPVLRKANDPFLLLFTSGTVGLAKGVAVPQKALLSFLAYMQYGIGLRENDVYWNVADPGWAYGLYYNVVGPLLLGHTAIFYDGPFTAESTYRILTKYHVTNLAAAPTAYRLLLASGEEAVRSLSGQLRVANSAGEPLNPEVIRWFEQNVGCSIYDQYGQTELGMVICNYHTVQAARHPGSMGLPLPGYHIVLLDEHFQEVGSGQPGQVAVDRSRSPLYWFTGYWQQETTSCYAGPYYLTGDTAEMSTDGTFTFIGRADDVITSAGYRIGPFDVESCLLEHPAVAESAVIGKPDPERTETVKAYVVLRPTSKPSSELAHELEQFVKQRLSAHAYPREVEFVETLPKTPSGKIQRFLLRQQEMERAKTT